MATAIFGAYILITSYHYLMSTKNPPCLNGEKVEMATARLRAFNHKHRFAIITELLDNGGMNPTRLAANLRLTESYIMEHLLVLQHSGMVNSIDLTDEVRFVANKRAIRKVNAALRSFTEPF
ncbi:MAG: helix-turn-helix transcriptional regulator [Saprospiraceae bacterium]|nr:helix-turn-helix transcriptional regulator [Saprospiraceae bacterium]